MSAEVIVGAVLLQVALIALAVAVRMRASSHRRADRLAAEVGLVRDPGETTAALLRRVEARHRAWEMVRGGRS